MKVLLSIKSEFVEKIFSGEKLFEYRKSIFKREDVTSVVIYATKPVGKIVGEFKIKKIHIGSPEVIWQKTHYASGTAERFYFDYFKGKAQAYAIEIGELVKYDEPINPETMFGKFNAPQSFCYI